ncbi:hypothetical protein [Billgrantia saliphila]|uniref:hypothetical protein n=1 Tax=Billgrantia saliphila TaxID=1848458 RepID=UPI000CE425E0|nr:hypothetical protein [Halomonas saliphila]
MSEIPTKIARLVLVLDELLTLAEAHERAELTRYRRLAFSFLPYDTAVSRLMASLGIQCEMRIDELRRVSHQLGLTDSAMAQGSSSSAIPHAFVSDPVMALETLRQAVHDADYSLRFHKHLREASAVPSLFPVMTAIIKQKQAEHAVLEGFLATRDDAEQEGMRA